MSPQHESHPVDPAVGRVAVRTDGGVAVITLDRERKRNALSTHMEAELAAALAAPEVRQARAVVITGGSNVFSAGADLTEVTTMTSADIAAYYQQTGDVYERFAALPQPTVAAIAGYCLGGGLELALAADLRIADATAILGFPEVGVGIVPSSGGMYRAVRAIGPAHTRDLVLRGRRIDAAEAHRLGLVTEITEAGGHLDRAMTIAGELAEQPALSAQLAKQAITEITDAPRGAALLIERFAYAALNQP